jgi:hypothetical protein
MTQAQAKSNMTFPNSYSVCHDGFRAELLQLSSTHPETHWPVFTVEQNLKPVSWDQDSCCIRVFTNSRPRLQFSGRMLADCDQEVSGESVR